MLNKKMLNKGQISIFVIISLIIIMISVFMIYNSKLDIFVSSDTKMKNQITDVVDKCLSDSANKGIFLLGFQGGKIKIENYILSNPKKYTVLGLKIPLWDSLTNNPPSIDSMKKELNDFVLSNANSCIHTNLESLKSSFNISFKGNLSVNSELNPENVVVQANLPIKFNEIHSTQSLFIENFFVKINSKRLADMFSLATQIYSKESQTNFLENLVIDQIESATDYSNTKLSMPSEGLTLSCAPKIWTIPQLKQNLANLNNNNFKYLHFAGTYSKDNLYKQNFNDKLGTKDLENYYLAHYNFDLPNKKDSFANYKVQFIMPSTEVTGNKGYFQSYPFREFKVTPSSGDIVKSIDLKIGKNSKIPIPCMQIFHHLYTLDYDIIVRITDMNTDGDHYVFQFPLRVLIDKNSPKIVPQTPIVDTNNNALTSEKYCAQDQKQYPYSVYVKDAITGDLLNNANISYSCLSYSCDMGTTSKPKFNGVTRFNADPVYTGNFPYCYNGYVKAEKKGYHFSKVMVKTDSSLENGQGYSTIALRSEKEYNIDKGTFLVVDKETHKGHRIFSDSDGQIYVDIENKGLDFESSVYWPIDSNYNIYNKLKLLEGDEVYNISIIYADKDGNLKGIYQMDNKHINSNNGNTLQITIPGSINEINQDNYMDFISYMNDVALTSDKFGINII